jgi:ketosteroid isomerase-like protein
MMKARPFVLILLAIFFLAACRSPSPEALLEEQAELLNAGDIDAVMELYADEIEIKIDPPVPPGSPDTYRGKEETRAWLESLVSMNFQMETEILEVNGETVKARMHSWADPTRQLGVAPLVFDEVYTIRDGKIQGWTDSITEESFEALMAAMPKPLGEAVLGTWEWDHPVILYLQFHANGTYNMHAEPWPQDESLSALEALEQGPGDHGRYQIEGDFLTITSAEGTGVCSLGDVAKVEIRITEEGKLEYAIQSEDCETRRPPGEIEYFSRIEP